MKACWADATELPGECVHDTDEIYNCIHAKHPVRKEHCKFWDPQLAIELCLEILGDKYRVTRTT